MSWKIQISRAKPNPQGKDTTPGHRPKVEQLLGEWVDLSNIGDQPVSLSKIHLAHTEFGLHCTAKQNPTIYWNGNASDVLQAGQIVRVHTGRSADAGAMRQEDRAGVHLHAYAESASFVLNNDCGDALSVWWKDGQGNWQQEDHASYAPNPPEGVVLKRVGAKLVPA